MNASIQKRMIFMVLALLLPVVSVSCGGGGSTAGGGVGGTGVVTIGQIIGMAAHLDGLCSSILDMTGLAQKYGAVMSHVRVARGTVPGGRRRRSSRCSSWPGSPIGRATPRRRLPPSSADRCATQRRGRRSLPTCPRSAASGRGRRRDRRRARTRRPSRARRYCSKQVRRPARSRRRPAQRGIRRR